ncbi:MAG TPA: WecB/TagA/CpsF family glycosyltransferase [Naasia sp.]|jgi:N-acetylglucosaminyldiphosphoundecaprenol N-acetyl-beta-D-mannosaminyltransferase
MTTVHGRAVTIEHIRFDAMSEPQVVAHVIESVKAGESGLLVTPNTSILRMTKSPSLASVVERAGLVVADGMPLIWAARLKGTPLPERVAGASLIWSLSTAAAANGVAIYLIGGAEAAAAEAAGDALREHAPGLRVAGWDHPPFGFEDDEQYLSALAADIRRTSPGLIFVGLGFPKQELVAEALRARGVRGWFLGCGAAINFAGGHQTRAPIHLQKSGLEWLHRLLSEPRRLAPRYARDAVFAAGFLARASRDGLTALLRRPAPGNDRRQSRSRDSIQAQ